MFEARRIMCMKRGTKLNEVFDRLKKMLDTIESIDGIIYPCNLIEARLTSRPAPATWARACARRCTSRSRTSPPTARRTKAKAVCKPLGLSVSGTGGEHTPIGTIGQNQAMMIFADGTVPTAPWTSPRRSASSSRSATSSPSNYSGISDLMVEEKKAPRRWR